jgi:hypothetical protein
MEGLDYLNTNPANEILKSTVNFLYSLSHLNLVAVYFYLVAFILMLLLIGR